LFKEPGDSTYKYMIGFLVLRGVTVLYGFGIIIHTTRRHAAQKELEHSGCNEMTDIRPAELPRDLNEVRRLFREYAEGLNIDLEFQDFEAEVAALPGKYEPPKGRLLLAWNGTNAVGCVALRPIEGDVCEMKRLYVRREARGEQLGRRLVERICQEARSAGYSRICLDSLPTMSSAINLYMALGFRAIEPYVFNPVPGAVFLAREL
jgi:GNAT superfamily N-acetyltransferase